MKRCAWVVLGVMFVMTVAGCASLSGFMDKVTDDPNVPQVVSGLSELFGGVPIVGTVLGLLGWGVTFAKKMKQDKKIVAIAGGVQNAINSIKDKQVVEAIKDLLREEANFRGVGDDIKAELAYLRSKGLIPTDKSGT